MKALNLKNMKETLVNYSGEQSEMTRIWDSFYHMVGLGFIPRETWNKFYEQCRGWYIEDGSDEVRDSAHDDALVWKYNPETLYHA